MIAPRNRMFFFSILAVFSIEARAVSQDPGAGGMAEIFNAGLTAAGQSEAASSFRTFSSERSETKARVSLTDEAGFAWEGPMGLSVAPVTPVAIPAEKVDDLMIAGPFASRISGDGAQALAARLHPDDALPSWKITMPDSVRAAVANDGRVQFLLTTDGVDLVLNYGFDKPWAFDADGKSLPTWYELHDDILVQHVDDSGARFPIVMDPRLTYGLGVYLNLTGAEIKAVGTAVVAAGGAAAVATCSGISRLPVWVGKVAAVVCTAAGAPTLKGIYSAIVKIAQSNAYENGSCYQMKIVPKVGGINKVTFAGNCRA